MKIHIITMTGKVTTVHSSDSVMDLKQQLCNADGYTTSLHFVYNGKILEDTTLSHYGIVDGSRVHVQLRFRGGMFHPTSSRTDYDFLH